MKQILMRFNIFSGALILWLAISSNVNPESLKVLLTLFSVGLFINAFYLGKYTV